MIKLASRSRGQNSRSRKYNRFWYSDCFAVIYIHTAMNVSVLFCSVLQASDRTFMITILIFLVISFTTRTAHTTQLLIRNENLNVKFHEIMFPIPCDKYHGKTFGQRNVRTKTYTIPHHWRIQGGAPGTRAPPPRGPNSFIFMQFSAKMWKIIAILGVGAPPLGKILDPPLHIEDPRLAVLHFNVNMTW